MSIGDDGSEPVYNLCGTDAFRRKLAGGDPPAEVGAAESRN
jgi:hypothetical protein